MDNLPRHLERKYTKLTRIVKDMGSVVVAFSGGVDSTLLVTVVQEVLGGQTLAVIAVSETYTEEEYQEAVRFVKERGIAHQVIKTEELQDRHFADNPPERCYWCKSELFGKLQEIARERGIQAIVDGTNTDDVCHDIRPGLKASKEKGVRHPLQEAGFSKEDIRALSCHLGLPTWNKPAAACLSSRIPYGDKITGEKLQMIGRAEACIRQHGFRQVRVRHHGKLARIEVPAPDLERLSRSDTRQKIITDLKAIGYTYVTLDLQGYRTGSMNEVLSKIH